MKREGVANKCVKSHFRGSSSNYFLMKDKNIHQLFAIILSHRREQRDGKVMRAGRREVGQEFRVLEDGDWHGFRNWGEG